MKRNLISVLFILVSGSAFSQIYPATQGSFIVFHEKIDKNAPVTLECTKEGRNKYEWPSSPNAFIQSFREAEKLFRTPAHVTDEVLSKTFAELESKTEMGFHYYYSPAMLIALGQAAYHPDSDILNACQILKGQNEAKTLPVIDQRVLVQKSTIIEEADSKMLSIMLKLVFPKNSWVDSARVYKKVLGSNDSTQIFPFVYTTQLSDGVEMHIRDTARLVGEFLYTIQPMDKLGITHKPLPAVYANNYNQLSAPMIYNFQSTVLENSKTITLSWDCRVRERVRAFEIYRALEYNGRFERIASLPASDSTYVDHVESVMRNFYYYIQILDQDGPGAKSITHFVTPLKKEKPQPPIDLIASPVKNGVLLKWPIMDGMYHIRGYYVYRQGRDTSSWTQVSEFIPRVGEVMSFIDSSSSLQAHEEYTFAVRSESTSYELSDRSITAMGRPGKARNIVTPMDFSWRHLDDGVLMLHWGDHRKHDPYITQYRIYTANANGLPDKEVAGSPMDVNLNFWMQPAGHTSAFGYCLVAEDAWGNKSLPSSALIPIKPLQMLSPGIILVHPSKTGYKLSWGLPDDSNVKAILLYEQSEDGKSTLVQSFKPTVNMHELPPPAKDKARTFFLKWKLADGTESTPGEYVILSK